MLRSIAAPVLDSTLPEFGIRLERHRVRFTDPLRPFRILSKGLDAFFGDVTESLDSVLFGLTPSPGLPYGDRRRSVVRTREVPDSALDEYTERGRRLGQGRKFWIPESFQFEAPQVPQPDHHGKAVRRLFQDRLDDLD
jgi:hypothetical protein